MSISNKDTPPPAASSAASPAQPPAHSSGPLLPRRTGLAVALSALIAGLGATLIWLGSLDIPTTDSFRFSRGTGFASGEEQRLQGFLVPATQDDRLMVVILGHTGQQGDTDANQSLSEARAAEAAKIATALGIPADQLLVQGVAGSAPAPRAEGLSDRAYQASLARVDVTLKVRR